MAPQEAESRDLRCLPCLPVQPPTRCRARRRPEGARWTGEQTRARVRGVLACVTLRGTARSRRSVNVSQ